MSLSLTATYIQAFCLNPWSSWPFQAFPTNQFKTWNMQQIQEARAAWGLFESIDALDADVRILRAGEIIGPGTGVNDPSIWTDLLTESVYDDYNYGQYLHTLVSPEIDWTSQRHLGFPPAGTRQLTLRLLVPYPISVTNPQAIPQHKSAIVLWPQPTIPVVKYTVTSNPDAITSIVTPPSLSTVINGLTDGSAYTFSIVSTDALGLSSPPAVTAPVIPRTNPSRPSKPTGTAGAYSIRLVWSAPVSDGANGRGGPLIYTVRSDYGNIFIDTSATTLDISGLEGGYSYSFTVVATNIFGLESEPSQASLKVATLAKPSPPRDVVGVGLDSSGLITWSVPFNIGGSSIVSYFVTIKPGTYTATVTDLSAIIPGLVNGIAYTATVIATNLSGSSPPSEPSPLFIPAGVPSVPLITAIPGNQVVNLSWNSLKSGGFPVVLYKYFQSVPTVGPIISTPLRTATVTGLTNGTSYAYTVVSTNRIGDSAPSTSFTVTPGTVASAPTLLNAIPGIRQAVLTWTTPTINGFATIQSYTVLWLGGSQTFAAGLGLTNTVISLANGLLYSFTVVANNYFGASLPSNAISCQIPDVPGPPTSVVITAGTSQTCTISWTAPLSTGGSPITGYVVTCSDTTIAPQNVTGATATFTGLTNGVPYIFTVNTKNAVGLSTPVTVQTTIGAPSSPPTSVLVLPGDQQATVTWGPPNAINGGQIQSYTVSVDASGHPSQTIWMPNPTTATFTGLVNASSYIFRVRATNPFGNSLDASASMLVGVVPDPPTNVQVTIDYGGNAVITWIPPLNTGGLDLSGFLVSCSDSTRGILLTLPYTHTATFTNLSPGTSYSFSVITGNRIGFSLAAWSPMTLVAIAPGTPAGLTAVCTLGQAYTDANTANATLLWFPPTSTGGVPVTTLTYTASCSAYDHTIKVTGTSPLTATFTGIPHGPCTFYVYSQNEYGVSAPAQATIPIYTVSSVPQNLIVRAGVSQKATLSWTKPANMGGSDVSGYAMSCSDPSIIPISVSTLTGTISGLLDGSSYVFYVTATNTSGSSAPAFSALTLIGQVPDQPLSATVAYTQNSSSNTSYATLSWTDGLLYGNRILSYTVGSPEAGAIQTVTAKKTTFNGLITGNSYEFYIFATNVFGNSAITSFTRAYVPGAPIITKIIITSGNAEISWLPPQLFSGTPSVSRYYINSLYNNFGTLVSLGKSNTVQNIIPGTTLPYIDSTTSILKTTISGLTDGNYYAFTVFAENMVGVGPPGTSALFLIGDIPSASTFTVTVPPNQPYVSPPNKASATVTWTAPEKTNGAPIISYDISCNGQKINILASKSIFTYTFTNIIVSPLPQIFYVTANNSFGPATATATAVVGTVPATIGIPTVVTTAPTSPYTTSVYCAPGQQFSSTAALTISFPSSFGYPQTGGADISGFIVEYQAVGEYGFTKLPIVGVPIAQSIVYLPIGKTYYIGIAAVNKFGTALFPIYPTPSGSNYPLVATVPNKPVISSATVPLGQVFNLSGNSSLANVNIEWADVVGSLSGGSPVTSYTISVTASNNATGTLTYTNTTLSSICTLVSSFVTGVTYTFIIRAINAFGTSEPSIGVSSSLVMSVPNAPQGVSLKVKNNQPYNTSASIDISWNNIVFPYNGGSNITQYVLDGYYFNNTVKTPLVPSIDLSNVTTINGINSTTELFGTGKIFYLKLSAKNAAGTSLYSTEVTSPLVGTVPNKPRISSVTVASDQPYKVVNGSPVANVTLKWSDISGENGGSLVTSYAIKVRVGIGPYLDVVNTATLSNGEYTMIYTPYVGNKYKFSISATNKFGTSVFSDEIESPLVASVPEGISITSANDSTSGTTLDISWERPANGGSPITGYNYYFNNTQYTTNVSPYSNGTSDGVVITNLTWIKLNDNRFTVEAKNIYGTGNYRETTGITVYSAETYDMSSITPTLDFSISSTYALLQWTIPTNVNASPISGYNIWFIRKVNYSSTYGTTITYYRTVTNILGHVTSVEIPYTPTDILQSGYTHKFIVSTRNSINNTIEDVNPYSGYQSQVSNGSVLFS